MCFGDRGRQALAMSCWFLRGKIFFGIQGKYGYNLPFLGGGKPVVSMIFGDGMQEVSKDGGSVNFSIPLHHSVHIRTWDFSLGIPQHIPDLFRQ